MTAHSPILADPISTFIPGCGDDERKVRGRLYRARDIATSRVTNVKSGDARELYWMAIRTCTEWLYRPAKLDELRDAIDNCTRLFMCAGFFEREEQE
jgi:hypothetical protein